MLILLTGAFISLWRQESGANVNLAEGDLLHRIILIVAYAITLPVFFHKLNLSLRAFFLAQFASVLTLFSLVSIIWSDFPLLTLQRSIALILTTLYGIVLIKRFTFNELLDLLGNLLIFVLLASVILIVFVPNWGRMDYGEGHVWRGVFTHKNSLGLYSALAILVFSTLFTNPQKIPRRLIHGFGIILAIVLLFGSRSTTGIILAVLLISGLFILKVWNSLKKYWKTLFFSTIGVTGIIIIISIITNNQEILMFFGKEQSLTGRIPLWKLLFSMALDRKWLGYGYGAFWSGWNGQSAIIWETITNWQPYQAHNGFLDVWLNLGIIGVFISLVLLFQFISLAYKRLQNNHIEGSFWILFIFFIIGLNLVESNLFRENSFFWVIIVYGLINLNHKSKEVS